MQNIAIYTKLLAVILGAALVYANQRWGLAFPVDTATMAAISGAVIAVLVGLSPANKLTTTQAAQVVVDSKADPVVAAKVDAIVASDKADAKVEAAAAKAAAKEKTS